MKNSIPHHLRFPYSILILTIISPAIAADIFKIEYKGCANSNTNSDAVSGQFLAALADDLNSHSTTTKFYNATSGNSTGDVVSGLFQCRGDLSAGDCAACVARVIPLWTSLCGAGATAARVQLTGCYALYQISGFPEVAETQLLFKNCNSGGGGDFESKRDTALAQLENGVSGDDAGLGFYTTSYGAVYALAQCEGDLSAGNCSECATQAVEKAKTECGEATSVQIYLNKCYISYNYYSNGVPSNGSGGKTTKTVAIALGVAAAVGFFISCLLFAKGLLKKKDDF